MNIKLSDHFDYKRLLRFALPSIIMMIFTSIYCIVDGFFVSNYAGKTAFAAVNLIMPLLLVLGCVGFMFGTGGGALIAKTMGERKQDKANEIFTLIITVSVLCGVVLAVLGFFLLRPVAEFMGAEGELLEQSIIYGRIILIALPFYILQFEFQCLFATAEKPKLGLYVTVASGVANMILDALLVGVIPLGVTGAAAATAISEFIGGVVPLVYFARKNDSRLRLVKFKFDGNVLLKTCTNGSSEFMSNVSMSIVSMLYNMQLMKYAGADGVAAYGVLMYVSMIFQAIFIGFAVGTAPIVGFNFGAQHYDRVYRTYRLATRAALVISVGWFAVFMLLPRQIGMLFAPDNPLYLDCTAHCFRRYMLTFFLYGAHMTTASFLQGIGKPSRSVLIPLARQGLFLIPLAFVLSARFGLDGALFAVPIADTMAFLLSMALAAAEFRAWCGKGWLA